jgi:hypothetical protein
MSKYVSPASINELLALEPMPAVKDTYLIFKKLHSKFAVFDVKPALSVSGGTHNLPN